MPSDAADILARLAAVAHEREERAGVPLLAEKVGAIKRYQQQRFARTYEDLLGAPRYGAAAHFFLDELYGPDDYRRRDAQFARVVPMLDRLFPQQIVETVSRLAELHALSERLDTRMGSALGAPSVDAAAYIGAWRATGEPHSRERQIELMLTIGRSLDRLVRNPVIRQSLRVMRGPASAAGLGELQEFLESGLGAFRAMKGAADFLGTIEARERSLAVAMFAADDREESRWKTALANLP
jgi:hypothetical protein